MREVTGEAEAIMEAAYQAGRADGAIEALAVLVAGGTLDVPQEASEGPTTTEDDGRPSESHTEASESTYEAPFLGEVALPDWLVRNGLKAHHVDTVERGAVCPVCLVRAGEEGE